MMASNVGTSIRGTGRFLILLTNVAPLLGVVALGWRPSQALFVYWIEIGLTLLCYFGLILFAQRESNPDRNRGGSYPGPISVPRRTGSIQPLSRLPPIRYQNVRYVPAAIPIVAILWFVSSRLFLEYPAAFTISGSRALLSDFVAYTSMAYSPTGLMMAVGLFAVRAHSLGRDFFRRRLVDRYSAAMILEIPCRIALFWFVVLIVLAPVSLLGDAEAVSGTVASGAIAAVVVGVKLAIDDALVRSRRSDPGWFAGLFVPNGRKPDAEADARADDHLQ